MNTRLHKLIIVLLLATSCNKPLPDYSGQKFDYNVTGVKDITIASNDLAYFYASVTLISGDPISEPVTVTFKGIPDNIIIQKDKFSFRLNYGLMDSFAAHNATPGVYPMQAVFSNPSTDSKVCNFNLIITAPVDRIANIIGYYYPSNSCSGNIYVSCEIDSLPGYPGKIMIIDRTSTNTASYGTFDTSYGMIDCCTNTFVIPSQKVNGVTVSGSGSSNGQNHAYRIISMRRTFVTDTSNYPCIVTLTEH